MLGEPLQVVILEAEVVDKPRPVEGLGADFAAELDPGAVVLDMIPQLLP